MEDLQNHELSVDNLVDEEVPIRFQDLQAFNEFESDELEVSGDVDFELLEAAQSTSFKKLARASRGEGKARKKRDVVKITFVDEKDIPIVVEHSFTKASCSICLQVFSSQYLYEEHKKKCTIEDFWLLQTDTNDDNISETCFGRIVTREAWKNKWNEILRSCLKYIIEDRINNIVIGEKESLGNKIVKVAKVVQTDISTDLFLGFNELSIKVLYDILSPVDVLKNESKKNMWSSINDLIIEKGELKDSFILACKDRCVEDEIVFQNLFIEIVMYSVDKMVSFANENLRKTEEEPDEESAIDQEEEQIICYVSGFIIFSLKKKCKRLRQNERTKDVANAVVDFLYSLQADDVGSGNSFKEYINQWIDLKSRGGLVRVNADAFKFFSCVEEEVRKTLTVPFMKSYRGQDLRSVLLKRICKSVNVIESWNFLTRSFTNEKLIQLLKMQMIMKWIDIRARSYVDTYVQLLLHDAQDSKKKPSQQGEPSLRRELFTTH